MLRYLLICVDVERLDITEVKRKAYPKIIDKKKKKEHTELWDFLF